MRPRYPTLTFHILNSFADRSIGATILRLKEHYQEETKGELLNKFISDLAKEKTPALTPEVREFIQKIDDQSVVDNFTVFVKTADGSYHDETYKIHLSEILAFVWAATKDDQQYTHHYTGSEEEKLEQAKQDQPKRIKSFFNCLNAIQADACHRMRIVSTLHKTYKDVDIIEDGGTAVLDFLRETTRTKFFEQYHTASPAQKKELTLLLSSAIKEAKLSVLLNQLDPTDAWQEKLNRFFLHHGSDPGKPIIAASVKAVLESYEVELPYDEKNPRNLSTFLPQITSILSAEEKTDSEERDNALAVITDWIKTEADLDNPQHRQRISGFYLMDKARREFQQHHLLLITTGTLPAEEFIDEFRSKYTDYFQQFKQDPPLRVSDTSTEGVLQITSPLNRAIQAAKKNSLSTEIENFFGRWFTNEFHYYDFYRDTYSLPPAFAADTALVQRKLLTANIKGQVSLQNLYAFLRNPAIRNEIILTDETLKKSRQQNTVNEDSALYLDISPYEINRVFLHAILIDTQNWTNAFNAAFEQVLKFVKNTLKKPGIEHSLKTISYPPELIEQLDYLSKKYQCEKANPPLPAPARPEEMILLPEQMTTVEDWRRISSYLISHLDNHPFEVGELEEEKETPLEAAVRDYSERLIGILLKNPRSRALSDLLAFMPKTKHTFFIEQVLKTDLLTAIIRNYNDLTTVFYHLLPEDCFALIKQSGLNLKGIIQNGDQLSAVLKQLPRENRLAFIEEFGLDLKTIIKNAEDLEGVLLKLPSENCLAFLERCNLDLTEIITTRRELSAVLRTLPLENRLAFILRSGLNLKKIITTDEDLIGALISLPREHQLALILLLITSKINELREAKDERSDSIENNLKQLNSLAEKLAQHEQAVPAISQKIKYAYHLFELALLYIDQSDTKKSITYLIKETKALADTLQRDYPKTSLFFTPKEHKFAVELKTIIQNFTSGQTKLEAKPVNRR